MLYCPGYKNEVGKINVACEGFVISETQDAYTFVLDSLFKMCPLRGVKDFYTVLSDEFMIQSILYSIDMKDIHIFYDHYHLKFNLEKALLMKYKVLKPFINLLFKASDEKMLNALYEQAIIMCENSNQSVMILINLMKKKIIGHHI